MFTAVRIYVSYLREAEIRSETAIAKMQFPLRRMFSKLKGLTF